MQVLIIAAHPDDEVLGAGGTIARHALLGDSVHIAILGEGGTSRLESGASFAESKDTVFDLNRCARRASEILGAKSLRTSAFPDNRFDAVDLLDIVKTIEKAIADLRPTIIYTHFWGDLNIDHSLTARAVLTACRPIEGSPVKKLIAFEIPSATGWGFPEQSFSPNVFVNIENTLNQKIEAMQVYSTEIRPFPHPRSSEALKARAKTWGSIAGLKAAEPFMLIREVLE